MVAVGLTGGIGSGKTFVATLFEKLGVPVFNADLEAKLLMNTSDDLRNAIIAHFGGMAYQNNQLNRAYLAKNVFKNPQELAWLNSIVHPEVNKHFKTWLTQQAGVYCIKEAAILIESGSYKQCNEVILVTAPEVIRIQRVMKRDNLTETEVRHRIRNQWTDDEKLKFASYSIVNDGQTPLDAQVEAINRNILTKYTI